MILLDRLLDQNIFQFHNMIQFYLIVCLIW